MDGKPGAGRARAPSGLSVRVAAPDPVAGGGVCRARDKRGPHGCAVRPAARTRKKKKPFTRGAGEGWASMFVYGGRANSMSPPCSSARSRRRRHRPGFEGQGERQGEARPFRAHGKPAAAGRRAACKGLLKRVLHAKQDVRLCLWLMWRVSRTTWKYISIHTSFGVRQDAHGFPPAQVPHARAEKYFRVGFN